MNACLVCHRPEPDRIHDVEGPYKFAHRFKAPRSRALAVVRFRVVCAWCLRVMERGTPNATTSHGICDGCAGAFA